jgi:RNA polymerase sigma-70 factor (ECF subfamily)
MTRPAITESQGELDADARLMLQAKAGEPAGLAVLYEKHRRGVMRYIYRQLQDLSTAEDLTQEVFLRVHRNRLTYQPSAKFTTWVYRIAANVASNWKRDHSREASFADGSEWNYHDHRVPVDDWMVREARREEVRQAVADLPERQRTVVVLHKFEEVEGQQIAERLGCSHQAVRSTLFRAYETLRVRLAHMAVET